MQTYLDEIDDQILVLVADGGLDARNARELGEKLETLVDTGIRELIVDCSKLSFISSAGIGTLIAINRKLKARGGQVHLAGATGPVPKVIRLAHLETVLGVHQDVGRAKHALRRAAAR
jgi:anti-sigma B factor antagonist